MGETKKKKQLDNNYRRFLAATGNDVTQLEYRGVKVHQLHEIVRVLEGVVQDYPGCCFDLTGGDDLTMVDIGVVYERHREQGLEMHQYNIRTETVYVGCSGGNISLIRTHSAFVKSCRYSMCLIIHVIIHL